MVDDDHIAKSCTNIYSVLNPRSARNVKPFTRTRSNRQHMNKRDVHIVLTSIVHTCSRCA